MTHISLVMFAFSYQSSYKYVLELDRGLMIINLETHSKIVTRRENTSNSCKRKTINKENKTDKPARKSSNHLLTTLFHYQRIDGRWEAQNVQ